MERIATAQPVDPIVLDIVEKKLEELLSDDSHYIYVYDDNGNVLAHLFSVLITDDGDTVLTDKKTLYIEDFIL